MLIKVQKWIFELDDVCIIYPSNKYGGEIYFTVELKNKQQIRIGWQLSKVIDSEEVIFLKLELLRNEIIKMKNKSDTIIELGQGISMKKEKLSDEPNTTQIITMRAAKKCAKRI